MAFVTAWFAIDVVVVSRPIDVTLADPCVELELIVVGDWLGAVVP